MEMVIQPVVSASVAFLLGKIASSDVVGYLTGNKNSGFDLLLQKLETKFLALSAVLADAELKQIRNPAVEQWLDKLDDVLDDAKDLFDEVEYDALKIKVETDSRSRKSKVRNFFSPSFNSTDQNRKTKMEEILAKLENFEKGRYILNLEEAVRKIPSWRPPSTSLIDDSEFYGRDDEKRCLKEMLLSDEVGGRKVCVIPIVGMGGIGKTTLAQAVYNDDEINRYFVVKAWVCVSVESDVCKVTKTVFEAVTRKACKVENLDVLQGEIQEMLKGKKFLIVLDDVWTENKSFWDSLRMPFEDGAEGSKIIMTTRSGKVASIMGTVGSRHLEELKEEACLKLLAKYVSGRNEDYTKNSNLETIGKEIVKKCKGLPLAVKALAGLLRSTHVEEWERIAKSDILDLPDGGKNDIIPALRLSYHYLPSHLKQCFAYCSLFPKDYEFEKEELVLRWMAECLLEHPKRLNMELEDVGNEYFNDLVSRSFFQRSSFYTSHFVMHDLIVDLAKSVSRRKYFLQNEGKLNEIVSIKQARHITFDIRYPNPHEIFKSVYEATHLHSILPIELRIHGTSISGSIALMFTILHQWSTFKIQEHDLLKLSYLRYLSLYGRKQVKQLPKSIGNLKHLRYLDLSLTSLTELPNSITLLYNLQTLKLSRSTTKRLPRNFHRLINLRYLDVEGNENLVMMPTQISKLKSLQRLSAFYVGIKNGKANIGELGKFPNLRGTLCIDNLQNITKANDVGGANLRQKKYLEELELKWRDKKANASEHERDVLDQLLPNTTLKKLDIFNYGGRIFSKWLGDQSFDNLVGLSLFQCEHCETLPSLGQLPSLKTLSIGSFDAIEMVGPEFYGTSSPMVKPFPSLESLSFYGMPNWKKWSMPSENVGAFQELRTFSIDNCDRLIGNMSCVLPSLIELSILSCLELTSLPSMPAINKIELRSCNRLAGFQVDRESFSYLQSLKISNCENFEFPPLDAFPSIRDLQIESCQNLEFFSLCETLKHLSSLHLYECPNFIFSPDNNLCCPILNELKLKECRKLKYLPDQMHSLLPSLQILEIWFCPELESTPGSQLPRSLRQLHIWHSGKFVASRKNWNLEALPNLRSISIQGYQCEDTESFPEQGLLPATITHLCIGFFCLKSLDEKGFQQLTSLENLNISHCPNLETVPEEGLPTSLEEFKIFECPLLEEKCKRETGEYWNKIGRIPSIVINNKQIQPLDE